MRTDSSLVLRKKYRHARHSVFDAFSTANALESWLAPHPDIQTTVVDFDFREGGRYEIAFRLPDGTQTALAGEYQRIEWPIQLCFTWCWQDPDPHAGIMTQVTVDFVDHGEETEVVVTHESLDSAEMNHRHAGGWPASLVRLQSWLDSQEIQ